MALPTDANHDGTIRNMAIVSHIDDDLLFMNPDIRHAIDAGMAHTTVYLTAGDAGAGEAYWRGREAGAKAAYADMVGASDWVDSTVTLTGGGKSFQIATSYLASHPDLRLYFLRVPDGNVGGGGFGAEGNVSLQKLWRGEIDSARSTDRTNSYSRLELVKVIEALVARHEPDRVMMQDHESRYMSEDHSDHVNASLFAAIGAKLAHADTDGYVGYGSSHLPENVTLTDADEARDTLRSYVVHDWALNLGLDAQGKPIITSQYEGWLHRQYHTDDFIFTAPDTWNRARNMRELGDANGDGVADLIGFGDYGVDVTASRSEGYRAEARWLNDFSYQNGGWRLELHDRMLADVNGDGRDDVLGFGNAGVLVSLSTGSGFQAASHWLYQFGSNSGFTPQRHVRTSGDVNGDGRDDVVVFGESGVQVALSTGSGFGAAQTWIRDFSYVLGNWRVQKHERMMADVNGDGRDDVVGFGEKGVLVALSTGSGFQFSGTWIGDYAYGRGGWLVERHERVMADVNGDGRADVVGFGTNGVLVSLSTGSSFTAPRLWSSQFGTTTGWNAAQHDRMAEDVNGDGRADIVAWGANGLVVALSDGDSFDLVDPDLFYLANGDPGDPLVFG